MMRRLLEYVHLRLDSVRTWLDGHPRTRRALDRTGALRFDRRAVARGVGIGAFVAFTPTVGVQTAMMLGGCLLVRGNFPAAFLISWVSNPITMAPLYVGYHALGERVFSPVIEAGLHLAGYGEKIALEVAYVALGSLLVAIPAGLTAYALVLWGWRIWVVQRRRLGLARRAGRPAARMGRRARSECPQTRPKGRSDRSRR